MLKGKPTTDGFKGKAFTGNTVERQNRKVEEMRGALIAVERALGKPLKELAQEYNCTQAAVKRYLDAAQESGFLEHFRALIYERMMGKALAVYEAQLDLGNLEAARDIVFGLGALRKDGNPPGKQEKVIDSLAEYRTQRLPGLESKGVPREEVVETNVT